jgi:hypothetical protein
MRPAQRSSAEVIEATVCVTLSIMFRSRFQVQVALFAERVGDGSGAYRAAANQICIATHKHKDVCAMFVM